MTETPRAKSALAHDDSDAGLRHAQEACAPLQSGPTTHDPATNAGNQLPTVYISGIIPPPVTGMTLMTEKIVRRLQSTGPVRFWNWSPGHQPSRLRMRVVRFARAVGSIFRLLANGRVHGNRFYVLANAKSGLVNTLLLTLVARRLGHRVYLHHHTYVYIDRYHRAMGWITRSMDENDVHIVHCEKMIEDFCRQYPAKSRFMMISPSIVSIDVQQRRELPRDPLRLGIISNLTIEKGVDLAIETFRVLHDAGRRVELILAGPVQSSKAKPLIDAAVAQFPSAVRHIGPVYDVAKSKFLSDIDVLLFPTRYKAESWGIVLDEAEAVGVPVVTFDRGCTATVVGDRAGLVVPRDGDYVAAAVDQIKKWMDDPVEYRNASEAAIEQEAFLQAEGHRQLEEFAEHMFSPLDGQ